MNTKDESYAASALHGWFKANQRYFSDAKMKMEFKDSGHNSACVILECDSHIMQICAWDNASCLDVEILDVATEESVFHHAGECGNRKEFEAKLDEFLNWYKCKFTHT